MKADQVQASPIGGGLMRAEINCRKCSTNVLVLHVKAQGDAPDQMDLVLQVQKHRWHLDRAGAIVCPDCWK